MDGKYRARWIMLSEFDKEQLAGFHTNESKHKDCHNWFAMSQGKLWHKYADGFYDKSVQQKVKEKRNKDFENKVIVLILRNNIFDFREKIYREYDGYKFNRKQMYYTEIDGCNIPVNIIQRIDWLIVENEIAVNRFYKSKSESEMQEKSKYF